MPVEKYSPDTNTWKFIAQMYDDCERYCTCSFIDDVYFIGEHFNKENTSCVAFSTTNKKWREIAEMKVAKRFVSCVVFEGRIVVSGGLNDNNGTLNTVEAYDHIDNSWTNMPSMIKRRSSHNSVAIKNKLFLVGGFLSSSIEVFDSHCNKFALFKNVPEGFSTYLSYISNVASVGNKVVFFSIIKKCILFYDIENNEWSEIHCKAISNINYFSLSKVPKL